MTIYVSFDESDNDPTYANANSVILVESNDTGENPCVGEAVKRVAPILPDNSVEIRAFASIMGWDVGVDNDGQIILYTGVSVPLL